MTELREGLARAIYERRHKGLKNCWSWDDSGLDDEHPGARRRYYADADAAIAYLWPLAMERAAGVAEEQWRHWHPVFDRNEKDCCADIAAAIRAQEPPK